MDPQTLQSLLPLGGYLVAGASAAYSWWASRQKDHEDDIKKLRDDNEALEEKVRSTGVDLERRIAKLENDMQHLPDKELVTDIRLALAKLEGTVGQFGEKLSGVAHIVGVIDESLRGNPK